MKPYFSFLDIARFFAAFWVMSFHYLLGLSGDLSWYRYGNLGVPLFFIISGFVISQSIQSVSLKKFAIGRFIRLYPLFWIICTLTYIFTLLMPNGEPVRFGEYLVSMTMLGDKFGAFLGLPGLVDPVYWSLAVELIFYTMIGTFVYIFTWEKIRYFFAGWLLLSLVVFLCKLDQLFIFKLLLVRHASYFVFGGILALIISHKDQVTSSAQRMFDYGLLLLAALYSTTISFKALPPYMTPHPLDTMIVTLFHPLFFIGITLAVYSSKYVRSEKIKTICMIIGGLTYPLYLVHQTVGKTLLGYFKTIGNHSLNVFIVMLFMILISYLFYTQDKKLRTYLRVKLHLKE